MLEATWSPYFVLSPTSDPCTVSSYGLYSATSPEVTWPASNTLVTLAGSFGSHELKVDKTVVTSSKVSYYLKATTKGLISVYKQFDVVICSPTSLAAQNTISSAVFDLNESNGQVTIPFSNFSSSFAINNCSYCSSPSYRILNSDLSTYTGSDIAVDASSSDIYLKTHQPTNTPYLLEAYFDSST